jgi:hypothetical protein
MLMSRGGRGKRKAKEEDESERKTLFKKMVMDIPETSPFMKFIDYEEFRKEQEEDELINEEDDDEIENIDEEEVDEEDKFLDRDIDFEEELDIARQATFKRRVDKVEWSGQEIKIDYDPYYAKIGVDQMSDCRAYPSGIFGAYVKLRTWLRHFVNGSLFENLMTLAVGMNTVTLALDHHGISESYENVLTQMNFVFTITFIVEMGLKLIGIGPIGYLKDRMNYLDGAVVLLSIFELAFLSGGGALSAFRTVRIMRTFRVLRVARLLKSMQSMQTIMDVIQRSFSSFVYLALLLLLFIFIYALLGMQTFGGKFDFDDGVPRGNFDSFNTAFVTVFQVLTMENWQVVLYDCMRSEVNKIITAIYLISWIFLGNFMLLNLFLAILLDSFAEEDESSNKSDEERKRDAEEAREEFLRKKGEVLILEYSEEAMKKGKNKKKGGFVKQKKVKKDNEKLMDESFDLEEVKIEKKSNKKEEKIEK